VNGVDLARFAGALGRRRAAILYENDSYGRGLMDAFRRNFRGEVVSADPVPSNGQGSYEPYITYVRAKKPDLVFVASTDQAGLAVLRAARAQKLDAAFLGGDGWIGVAADTAASQGVYVGTPFTVEDSRPEIRRFAIAFRAKYAMDPDANAALAYDATMLVARAIDKGGATREGVRDWLASLDERTAFAGVTGPIRFRESGEVAGKGFVMTKIDRGALRVAYEAGGAR
jgi:branched-chain amino acid transport system substrate-binding protein